MKLTDALPELQAILATDEFEAKGRTIDSALLVHFGECYVICSSVRCTTVSE